MAGAPISTLSQNIYGLVAISAPPKQLEKVFQTIYFKALPSIRVNRNTTKAFHTLPYKFQGLGLPDPNIEIFALKLHLIQNHWGTGSEVGKFLQHAYETFWVEIGISGNIFKVKFEKFHTLASDGWFKHLWELCDMFKYDFAFHDRYEVPMTRKDDKSIMDEIIMLTWYNFRNWQVSIE